MQRSCRPVRCILLAVLTSILKFSRNLKGYIPQLLSAGIIVIPLQGCGPSRLASDCDRLQKATHTLSPFASELIREQPLDKAASIFASKQQQVLAQQLAQMPLLDQSLSRYRSELVVLYRHDSDLTLQVTAFMADSGEIVVAGGNRSAYEQVASQRIAIAHQVQTVHNHIASYCGASAF